jgi:hypothetical protein
MKIFHFYGTGFSTILIALFPALPVLANSYYDSLPNPKREEIKIIDDHTVEVGIGPDNRTVSCNLLDAVQSIVGSGGRPSTVFVNKEKIHLFHNELYTWDRWGKYRVRLTTKYIREFGNIRIHVPEEGGQLLKEREPAGPSSSYLQNLPQKIREEITIIDEDMVEVAIGPDNHSVSTTLNHAVKSIPSVKENPDHVFVNDEPVYHIKEGVYAWDTEGKNLVRLTSKYIRKFGNIRIHIADNKSLSTPAEGTLLIPKDTTHLPKAEISTPEKSSKVFMHKIQEKDSSVKKPEIIPTPEVLASLPAVNGKTFAQPKPASPAEPQKIQTGVVKGFRLAQFGMSEEQVIKAIFVDFNLQEKEIEKRRHPKSGQRILTIASLTLAPNNGKAWVHYYFSSLDQTLNRVDVIWGHPDHPKVDPAILQESANRFQNLFTQFRQLKTQTKSLVAKQEPYVFYGMDKVGNGIKMMWDKAFDKNFKPIFNSEPTLTLSYFTP